MAWKKNGKIKIQQDGQDQNSRGGVRQNAIVYQEQYMNVGQYDDTFKLFCDSIPNQNATILEIACGPGNITKNLLEKRPDFKILATNLSQKMLRLAAKNNPTVSFQLLDSKDIGKLKTKYDGVMCGFLLPYLSKEEAEQFITDAATILNEESILYFSTMEDDYSKSAWRKSGSGDEVFMYYHQADYLLAAFNNSGFELIHESRQSWVWKDGTAVTDLILIGRKTKRHS